jgi:hypothetical protein
MEVHHPHHPTHKKKWAEYIVEFIMLFTAVTLGFFAENIREGFSEKEKGAKYLHLLSEDLKQDTSKINICIQFKVIKERQSDSLIQLLNSSSINDHTREIYYYSRLMPIREPFYGTEGTLKQLQNAGGFRNINNDKLVESINAYIAAKEKIYQIQDMQDFSSLQMRATSNKIFQSTVENEMLDIHKNKDYRYYVKPIEKNLPLASYDKNAINDYCNWVVWMMTAEKYDYVLLERLKTKAIQLIDQIKKDLQEK